MIIDKAEIKIAILAVFCAFGVEIDASDAQESILSTGKIGVLDCQECQRELIEEGLLCMRTVDGKLCCGVTQAGACTYEEGKDLLRADVREAVVSEALRHFEYICSGRQYESELYDTDGGYYVVCSLKSKDRTYMETKYFFDRFEDAQKALDICRSKPEVIYKGIATLITGKINFLF